MQLECISTPTLLKPLLKLDLGCGIHKEEGYTGVDITKEGTRADVAHDLLQFPWPFESDSVDEIFSSHFFEHVPKDLRGKFMDEAYRVLKVGCEFKLLTPYAFGHMAVQDFTHEWPPIVPDSYFYFDAEWRKANGMEQWKYKMECNFLMTSCNFILTDKTRIMTDKDKIQHEVDNHVNAVEQMYAVLKKR